MAQSRTLFNLSLSSGIVPTDWKLSNVTPVYKAGDPKLVSNYRPISLLSLPSKILERFVHNKLLHYLLSNSLLSHAQFGFRPSSSTQEAIISATTDWHSMLDSKANVAAVFFDLSKAFDTIPHAGILNALSGVGISGPLLRWFFSYLSNRHQRARVVLDGSTSSQADVTSGVPQGSILGPLLFILYMDYINCVPLSPTTKLLLYADDILLYCPIWQTSDVSTLQSDVDSISQWVTLSGLRLNVAKSKLLLLSRQRHPPTISLLVGGSLIPQVQSVVYLGVTLSGDLSWAKHIDNVCSKAKRQLGFLHRQFYHAGPPCLIQLYKSLVLPILDYCSCVWDPHFATHENKLESVQALAAKIATKQWNSNYNDLLKLLSWPRLSIRRKKQKVSLCHRIISGHSIIPPSFFSPHPSPHLRHNHHMPLSYPKIRTSAHLSSFSVSVIPLWNSLPPSVVSVSNSVSLKNALSRFFIVS